MRYWLNLFLRQCVRVLLNVVRSMMGFLNILKDNLSHDKGLGLRRFNIQYKMNAERAVTRT